VLGVAACARRGLAPGPRARRLGQEATPIGLSASHALRIRVAIGRLNRLPIMPANQATPMYCHGLVLLPHRFGRHPFELPAPSARRSPERLPRLQSLLLSAREAPQPSVLPSAVAISPRHTKAARAHRFATGNPDTGFTLGEAAPVPLTAVGAFTVDVTFGGFSLDPGVPTEPAMCSLGHDSSLSPVCSAPNEPSRKRVVPHRRVSGRHDGRDFRQEPTWSTREPTSAISHASQILPSRTWQMTA
jgi:hypothetical protein